MLLRVTRIWLLPCCASCPEKESAPGAPERLREISLPGKLTPLPDRFLTARLAFLAVFLTARRTFLPAWRTARRRVRAIRLAALFLVRRIRFTARLRVRVARLAALFLVRTAFFTARFTAFLARAFRTAFFTTALATALFTAAFLALAAADFIGVGDGLDGSMGVGAGSIQPESDQLISMSCSSAIVASSGGCRGVTPAAGVWAGCARLSQR